MNQTINKELLENLSLILKEGDIAKTKNFLIENFKSFPESVQDEITMAFMSEAIIDEANRIDAVTEMQKQGLEMMASLEKIKSSLEDELKAIDLTQGLKK